METPRTLASSEVTEYEAFQHTDEEDFLLLELLVAFATADDSTSWLLRTSLMGPWPLLTLFACASAHTARTHSLFVEFRYEMERLGMGLGSLIRWRDFIIALHLSCTHCWRVERFGIEAVFSEHDSPQKEQVTHTCARVRCNAGPMLSLWPFRIVELDKRCSESAKGVNMDAIC